MLNPKHFSTILTILEEGSVTAAARKLYVSQPALSQTIRQVEKELGAPIFNRDTDPISLTHEGTMYVRAVRDILRIDKNLHNSVADAREEVHGELNLGISIQRGLLLLPMVIPEFHERYPHVKINIIEMGSDLLEKETIKGRCDVAFVTTSETANRLKYVLIQNEDIVLMVNRETRLAKRFADGEPIELTDAIDETFVSMAQGHSVRVIQDSIFRRYGMTPNILLETHNMEAAKRITARSETVFLLPSVYVDSNNPDRFRVQIHPVRGTDNSRHFYFIYREGMYLSGYMRDLMAIVCNRLEVPCRLAGVDEDEV